MDWLERGPNGRPHRGISTCARQSESNVGSEPFPIRLGTYLGSPLSHLDGRYYGSKHAANLTRPLVGDSNECLWTSLDSRVYAMAKMLAIAYTTRVGLPTDEVCD